MNPIELFVPKTCACTLMELDPLILSNKIGEKTQEVGLLAIGSPLALPGEISQEIAPG
jgi:hypothetical protein